jgi:nucleoside transporter
MPVAGRLGVMMFLEYVIWGTWLPLLSLYLTKFLHFSGTEVGFIMGTAAIASVTTLFISGQIADRYLSSERFLAASHLVGGLAMIALAFAKTFWPFYIAMLVHQLMYVPTMSVTNSISFHHLKDAQKQFGWVRLCGTIGWIAASWPFFFLLQGVEGPALQKALTSIFWIAGGASLALAAFSLTLPHTPPARSGTRSAPMEALRLLAIPSVAVLFVVTLLDALVHSCYFQWTGPFLAALGMSPNRIMAAMSIGQVAEIPTMAILGLALKRLGWRKTMTFGILGHALRFAVYALGGPLWLVVTSNVVHGFCYAFFFASVYIFVDEFFPKDARASAQGLFNFLILGLGPFLGGVVWGKLGDALTAPGGAVNFRLLFLAPSALALLAAVVLFLAFHPRERMEAAVELPGAA